MTSYDVFSVPVKSVALSIDGRLQNCRHLDRDFDDDVSLIEQSPTSINCSVVGGSPPPRLRVVLRRRGRTGSLSNDDVIVVATSQPDASLVAAEGGVAGLRILDEKAEVRSVNFTSTRSIDGRLLTCVAHIASAMTSAESCAVRLRVTCEFLNNDLCGYRLLSSHV